MRTGVAVCVHTQRLGHLGKGNNLVVDIHEEGVILAIPNLHVVNLNDETILYIGELPSCGNTGVTVHGSQGSLLQSTWQRDSWLPSMPTSRALQSIHDPQYKVYRTTRGIHVTYCWVCDATHKHANHLLKATGRHEVALTGGIATAQLTPTANKQSSSEDVFISTRISCCDKSLSCVGGCL